MKWIAAVLLIISASHRSNAGTVCIPLSKCFVVKYLQVHIHMLVDRRWVFATSPYLPPVHSSISGAYFHSAPVDDVVNANKV